jgi:hypothetical protein
MADIQEVLHALSPEVLRGQFQLPHAAWREEYVARFLATESYEDMVDELGRFVAHVMTRWFGNRVPWPADRGRSTAVRLLNEKLGDGLHAKAGEFAAMKMCRHGDRGGIRYLLDLISEALLQESVKQYLDCVVLPRIHQLPFDESMDLARRYLETYDVVPGLAMESPAGIMMRWRQVIHQHARQVLAG